MRLGLFTWRVYRVFYEDKLPFCFMWYAAAPWGSVKKPSKVFNTWREAMDYATG